MAPTPKPQTAGLPVDPSVGLRLKKTQRHQRFVLETSLDESLHPSHPARSIWLLVTHLDLDSLYSVILSRGSNAGAPAIDPAIVLSLWVYAVSDGVGSAREIADLVRTHDAYRWLAGGVGVGAHHLSDFRAERGAAFDALVTQVVTAAVRHDLVELWRIGQDGTRVRASAGAASFRREQSLERLEQEVQQHVDNVLVQATDPKVSAVRRAAQQRGAKAQMERVQAALEELPKVAEIKKRGGSKEPPRVSTTDPEARVMKMGDGGFRPAYNVQFAENTDGALKLIVGVDVVNAGTDKAQAAPMRQQLEERYGQKPKEQVVDGGYQSEDALKEAAKDGCVLTVPLPKQREGTRPPTEPRPEDAPEVAEWRVRMQTEAAKASYRLRGQTCELPHADGKKDRGLATAPVRGLEGVKSWATLFTLSYNILRVLSFLRSNPDWGKYGV